MRRLGIVTGLPSCTALRVTLSDKSLNDGRGAIAFSRNPFTGTSPPAEGCMHIVPPVMMRSTLDSGYVCTAVPSAALVGKAPMVSAAGRRV